MIKFKIIVRFNEKIEFSIKKCKTIKELIEIDDYNNQKGDN